jgi:hypothetical protein
MILFFVYFEICQHESKFSETRRKDACTFISWWFTTILIIDNDPVRDNDFTATNQQLDFKSSGSDSRDHLFYIDMHVFILSCFCI